MDLMLHGTVGPSGRNLPEDVKLVRALLNVYRRKNRDAALPIYANTDPGLFAAIARFQVAQGAAVASGTINPGSASWQGLISALAASRAPATVVPPTRGRFTWTCEGQEGGPLHSRILRVPHASSGLILGRGYDLRERTRPEVQQQLAAAGFSASDAQTLSAGVRLQGTRATDFIVSNDLLDLEISAGCQLRLFEATYAEREADVQRLCARADVVAAYGPVDWSQLEPRMKVVLVDLHYRGDYTPRTRQLIQGSLVRNDAPEFVKRMADVSAWATVPAARVEARIRFFA